MLPTNCWREASRRHLLGLGKRLGGQSQQSDFHMLKLLFVQARPNCLGLAWRGGKPRHPSPGCLCGLRKAPRGVVQGRACGQPGQLQHFAHAWDSSGHGSEAEMGFPVPAGTPGPHTSSRPQPRSSRGRMRVLSGFSALSQSRKPSEGQGAPRATELMAQGAPEAGHPAGPR